MLKKVGVPLIALFVLLLLVPAPHAQAAVRVGVGIGFGGYYRPTRHTDIRRTVMVTRMRMPIRTLILMPTRITVITAPG